MVSIKDMTAGNMPDSLLVRLGAVITRSSSGVRGVVENEDVRKIGSAKVAEAVKKNLSGTLRPKSSTKHNSRFG